MACDNSTESGAQLLTRLSSKDRPSLKNLSPEIIPKDAPKPKDIIEISGDSNVGKTIHLMELIAQTILPVEYGGKEAGAIVIDTNSNFHVPLLLPSILEKHILHKRLINADATADTEALRTATDNVKEAVLDAIKNIFIYKCYTHEDLELALLNVVDVLTTNKRISLIAIDSIASFYWTDMLNRTQPIRMHSYLRNLLKIFRKINDEYRTILVFTRPAYFGNSKEQMIEKINCSIELCDKNDGIFEAKIFYDNNEMFSRYYLINNFGVQWMFSHEIKL